MVRGERASLMSIRFAFETDANVKARSRQRWCWDLGERLDGYDAA